MYVFINGVLYAAKVPSFVMLQNQISLVHLCNLLLWYCNQYFCTFVC